MKFCLFLMLLFSPVASFASEIWTRVVSKNFVLVGNLEENEIRRTGARLEQFHDAFQEMFPNKKFNAEPTTVVIFRSAADFKNFKPSRVEGTTEYSATGFFQAGDGANYIALCAEGNLKTTFQPIFHDYVHSLINKNFGRSRVPPWVSEGLAEYYQTFSVENKEQVRLGAASAENLRILTEQSLIPLERLFAFDYYTLRNQGNHGKSIFYAESWALIHYLQEGTGGKRRPQLKTFLNLLLDNKPAHAAFAEAFQTDLATTEKELKNYVAGRLFTSRVVLKNKIIPDAEMRSAPVSESEALRYQGDLWRALNRSDEAINLLRQAVKLDSKNALAQAALGATLAQQNKFAEARLSFEKVLALDSKNYLALYGYAESLSLEGVIDQNFVRPFADEKTIQMRELLTRVIELNASFSASYRLLAFVNFANNADLNEAIALLGKALAIEPGNEQYALDLGRVYLRQEKFDEARRFARQVFASAEEAAVRAEAQILLSNINSLEEQLRQIRERNARGDGDSNQPVIKYSEEELINQSINEALRRPRTGEKRVVGYLSNVVCSDSGINFLVRTINQPTNQTLKLRANDFLSVAFMAFTVEASGKPIDCGARQPEDFVVATYRSPTGAKPGFAGEMVAVEFVPETLKLEP